MSKKCNYKIFLFVLLVADILTIAVFERQENDSAAYVNSLTEKHKTVFVCGKPIGLYMETDGILIVDTGEIVGEDGIMRKPAENIVKAGDYILKANGKQMVKKKQLIKEIQKSNGEAMQLLVDRKGKELQLSLNPIRTEDTKYKLGIWIRDNTQGIGTMTYIDEEGKFGALGHGICDMDTGDLLRISQGNLYQARILSIVKGVKGMPGELSGYIAYKEDQKLGVIDANTDLGIFGHMTGEIEEPFPQARIACRQEVKKGKAELYTDIGDGVQPYDIEITKICRNRADTNKAFEIQVKDPALLEKTGGVIRGMSGSPIIQNGKLIGAVTHVFVQDSTKGYGIFIENML